jgi:hypothetical protein
MSNYLKNTTKERVRMSEEWRTKIKAAELINRLGNHAMGGVEMTATQIKAAEILLKKCLPDLQQVQANIEADMKVTEIVRKIVE